MSERPPYDARSSKAIVSTTQGRPSGRACTSPPRAPHAVNRVDARLITPSAHAGGAAGVAEAWICSDDLMAVGVERGGSLLACPSSDPSATRPALASGSGGDRRRRGRRARDAARAARPRRRAGLHDARRAAAHVHLQRHGGGSCVRARAPAPCRARRESRTSSSATAWPRSMPMPAASAARAARRSSYDHLVLAVGAKARPAWSHGITFGEDPAEEALHSLLDEIERGYVGAGRVRRPRRHGVATSALRAGRHDRPAGVEHGHGSGALRAGHAPRSGRLRSSVARRAERVGGAARRVRDRVHRLDLRERRTLLRAARPLRAAASTERGSSACRCSKARICRACPRIRRASSPPTCTVACPGLAGVYAAGDGAAFPIKQGGLAAQQADAVAESIAAAVGARVTPEPFRPVLRAHAAHRRRHALPAARGGRRRRRRRHRDARAVVAAGEARRPLSVAVSARSAAPAAASCREPPPHRSSHGPDEPAVACEA